MILEAEFGPSPEFLSAIYKEVAKKLTAEKTSESSFSMAKILFLLHKLCKNHAKSGFFSLPYISNS